ncbi:uncharacterized protein ACOB8E_008753 isoform 1-T1 [Sarcophilus harrisii]
MPRVKPGGRSAAERRSRFGGLAGPPEVAEKSSGNRRHPAVSARVVIATPRYRKEARGRWWLEVFLTELLEWFPSSTHFTDEEHEAHKGIPAIFLEDCTVEEPRFQSDYLLSRSSNYNMRTADGMLHLASLPGKQ